MNINYYKPHDKKIVMIVGIDVDDVIADFNGVLQPWHNKVYGTNLKREDITDYDLWNIWKCSKGEAFRRVHEFYKSSDSRKVKPVERAPEGILLLTQRYNLVAVTSRPIAIREETEDWIQRYFPAMFSSCYFTNAFGLEGERRKKSDVCKELGVNIMIEDSPTIAQRCYDAGIKVVVLNAPWNERVALPKSIPRVDDWDGIVEKVKEFAC